MTGNRSDQRRSDRSPTALEQARNELFSHILRCGVLEAAPEHRREWFDDTMEYLADRYEYLRDDDLTALRALGEQYFRPIINRKDTEVDSETEPIGAAG